MTSSRSSSPPWPTRPLGWPRQSSLLRKRPRRSAPRPRVPPISRQPPEFPRSVAKTRLDQLVHGRGLTDSREQARRLIMAGEVLVNGQVVDRPAANVSDDAAVEIKARPRFVSRGGDKLEAALEAFGLDVAGRVCADLGASTGGFTDALLQRGAARVYAIDVGHGI